MKRKEKRETILTRQVVVGISCNQCKRDIYDESMKDVKKVVYYEVITGHDDWGNDSPDSVQEKHFCSHECLVENVDRYFKRANGTDYYDIRRVERHTKFISE